MSRITGDELDQLWKVSGDLQTLDYEGTTVQIRIDAAGLHYVVNGSELERIEIRTPNGVGFYYVRVNISELESPSLGVDSQGASSPDGLKVYQWVVQMFVEELRARTSCQWDNGFWPPE